MNYAVVFAGGVGSRMKGAQVPKQFLEVGGKSIIIRTILNFENNDNIDGICVICIESWIDKLKTMLVEENIKKVKWVVPGGQTGQQSIYGGLKAIYDDSANPSEDIVLISDGVRPFLGENIIEKNIECVKKHGTSVTVCPVAETIVEINENGEIENIPQRSKCYLSKAPQGFYLDQIISAHNKAIDENRFDCTNSAELMRRYGHRIYTVEDNDFNIKITTPMDYLLMNAMLQYGVKDTIEEYEVLYES